jgi:hypothetical protein
LRIQQRKLRDRALNAEDSFAVLRGHYGFRSIGRVSDRLIARNDCELWLQEEVAPQSAKQKAIPAIARCRWEKQDAAAPRISRADGSKRRPG